MSILRIRSINIDVIPNGEPFIKVTVEKLIVEDGKVVQTVGNFDRIYKRLSDISPLPIETMADDGVLDPKELYAVLAQVSYAWVMEKHNTELVGGKLVMK